MTRQPRSVKESERLNRAGPMGSFFRGSSVAIPGLSLSGLFIIILLAWTVACRGPSIHTKGVDSGSDAGASSHILGLMRREVNLIAGANMTVSCADNASTGQEDCTLSASAVDGGGSSLPDPVTVPHGGTGDTTLTAHGVVLGEGASAASVLGPSSTNGLPLLNLGTSSDPAWAALNLSGAGVTSQVQVANGGTGDSTLTAHGVVIAEGTNPFVSVASGGAGTPLVNTGGASDPNFQVLGVAGGGTSFITCGASTNLVTSGAGGSNSPLRCQAPSAVGGTGQWANNAAACNVTTSLTTCVSISLTIASGQTAEIWLTGWVTNGDTGIEHTMLMEVNGSLYGEIFVPQGGSGSSITQNSGGTMLTDTTVGTNTYNFQIALGQSLSTGTVSCTRCFIRGHVSGP